MLMHVQLLGVVQDALKLASVQCTCGLAVATIRKE